MVEKIFDVLKRPPNWVDPRASRLPLDLSRVRHYIADDGLEYWLDPNTDSIRTSDESIYMTFHRFAAFDYKGHSYAKLHLDNVFVIVTSEKDDPAQVSFCPNFQERTEQGEPIWHVDQIFRTLMLPDYETYPWVKISSNLPKKKKFEEFQNLEQQNRFIYLVKTLLSCHCGAMAPAMRGDVTKEKSYSGRIC
ncbi:hypothetical protein [Parasedimentitalea psychrophila]|uniref:Uncharacterized protein n=1 Tax=Parasedimentitalea psychrophila TaxID=2997337 RepID=A0A9Y2L0G6_9RHOB|nr:hypothetical protein [Parasedimentitalea psychrophila]WIY24559.1 hypothetical protein QPJ95_18775 [Parasedimentitalea psychrophila]